MKESFEDSRKKTWNLNVNVGIALKIKQKFGVDLMGDIQKMLTQLSEDPALAIDIAWASISEDQKTENQCSTFEDFCSNLGGDSVEELINAVLGSITLFIPSRAGRKIMEKALEKKDAAEKEIEKVLMSGELEKMMSITGKSSSK